MGRAGPCAGRSPEKGLAHARNDAIASAELVPARKRPIIVSQKYLVCCKTYIALNRLLRSKEKLLHHSVA